MDSGPGGVLTVFTVVIGLLSAEERNCTVEELQFCLSALEAVAQREDFALASTRLELKAVCHQLQSGVRCVEEHTSRCFTSTQRRIFHSVVSESRQVIQDLCIPGELQEDYLLYAPCFKNITKDERKCGTKYRQIVEISEVTEQQNVEEGLRKTCCALTDFVQCQYSHVVKNCGERAEQFLKRHMERMSGSLINQHCAIYTHDFGACTSAVTKRALLPSLSVALVHVLLLYSGLLLDCCRLLQVAPLSR